jgi:aspartate/methionine/tyrosine aminotransferase
MMHNSYLTTESLHLHLLRLAYKRVINKRKKEILAHRHIAAGGTVGDEAVVPPFLMSGKVGSDDASALEDEVFEGVADRPKADSAMYYKYFFNHFFHKDLYGQYDSEENVVLSTGALDQDEMQLPGSLKYAIDFALANNWYGYSCSLGRESAREAIADLEKLKTGNDDLSRDNVALIKGVTDGLYHLVSFLKEQSATDDFRILTHLPTYIPFATACEKIARTTFVDLMDEAKLDVGKIIGSMDDQTKVVLLLADFNPIGKGLSTADINRLADHCRTRGVYLLVDEAGAKYPEADRNGLWPNPYLIRLESLSKKMSVPGMKLGYFIADKQLVEKFYERASTCYGGPASFFYLLQEFEARFNTFRLEGLTALTEKELSLFDANYRLSLGWLQFLYDDYRRNQQYFSDKIESQRSYAISLLNRYKPTLISDIIIPDTGINILVKLNSDLNSYEFFRKLLVKKGVAVFPGICSGVKDGCWVRITVGVKRDLLVDGLEKLIDFLKSEHIKKVVASDGFYRKVLLDWGGYGRCDNIDFSSHLYDVYHNALILRKRLIDPAKICQDSKELSDIALCHDAGKVVSVLVWRMHRVMRLQQRYDNVPRKILDKWRDEDLLGYKAELASGQPVSLADFYGRFPFVKRFEPVIAWNVQKPLKDVVFTKFILEQILAESGADKERVEKILAILSREVGAIPSENQLSPVDVGAVFFDVADKLADFNLTECVSRKDVICHLRRKEQYVKHRYGKADGYPTKEISHEFEKITKLVNRLFVFEESLA